MDQYELAAALPDEISAHARECYPEEACGIIAGAGGYDGLSLCRGRNLSPTPRVAFELDPDTLARQLDFEDSGLALTAIYHSHPAGPETPSQVDVDRISEGYPDRVTIVCSLADVSHPVLRAFRIVQGLVREVTLVQGRGLAALTNQSQGNTLSTKELCP